MDPVRSLIGVPILLLLPSLAAAQGTITGQAQSDETGQPIAGVQVYIGSLEVGTLSQANGRYLLQDVPGGTYTLTAERIGYRTETLRVEVAEGETLIENFRLREEAMALDEIVVTGTPGGTQRRALGNDVARISADDVSEVTPTLDVQGFLRGQATGVHVLQGTGQVGGGEHFRIRGLSSVSLSSYPLIYVDGIRVSNDRGGSSAATRDRQPALRINDLNPDEIESVEIIKGPAAATLYGTEASAGVIQIITKRGAEGAPRWNAGIEMGANYFRNPEDRLAWNYQIDPETRELTKWHPVHSYENHAFQNGLIQRYNLDVTGGTERIRYYLSGTLGDEAGYVDWNTQSRGNLRANLDAVLSDELDISLSSGLVRSNTRFPMPMLPYGYPGSWHWGHALRTQNDGHYTIRPEDERKIENRARVARATWSLTLNYQPFEWLRNRVMVGEDRTHEIADLLVERQPEGTESPFGGRGLGEKSRETKELTYWSFEYAATASFDVTSALSSSTSFGVQHYRNARETDVLWGREFAAPGLSALDAASRTTGGGSFIGNASLGLYVQQEFGWQNRIFVTGAVRGDDNSAFGTDYDAAIYPKLSAAWVLSEEDFWEIEWVNSFRLRGAWGMAGRQPDVFAAVSLYEPVTGAGGAPAVRADAVGNPELGPEVGKELEVGFEAGLLDDRIALNFTYYDQRTEDALMQVPMSMATGFMSSRWENLGLITNRGIELDLDAALWEHPEHRFDLGFNLSTNRNRVEDLGGVQPSGTTTRLVEGEPVGVHYSAKPRGGEWVGPPDPAEGGHPEGVECQLADGSWEVCDDFRPERHRVSYGKSRDPTWFGSAIASLTLWRNLRLTAQANFEGGHLQWGCRIGCSFGFFRIVKGITGDPANGVPPDPAIYWAGDNLATSDWPGNFDAGHVRLQTVSARYRLPDRWVERFGASQASIRVAGENLAFLWRAQEEAGTRPIIEPSGDQLQSGEYGSAGYVGFLPGSKITARLRLSF